MDWVTRHGMRSPKRTAGWIGASVLVMKLSPIEFAALFDGLDWTRVQTAKGILKPSVAA